MGYWKTASCCRLFLRAERFQKHFDVPISEEYDTRTGQIDHPLLRLGRRINLHQRSPSGQQIHKWVAADLTQIASLEVWVDCLIDIGIWWVIFVVVLCILDQSQPNSLKIYKRKVTLLSTGKRQTDC